MRYGVVSDVHANLHALETVLAELERAGVEQLLCPGDLVGYGPRPNECVARLREAGALAVAGNHDLMALRGLREVRLGGLQRKTMEWTRGAIDDDTRAYLSALPPRATTDDGVTLAHGSLDDPTVYVRDCSAGQAQLARLAEVEPAASAGLLLGHTHHPLACDRAGQLEAGGTLELRERDGAWLLNAGSVGQARERQPLARALVLDTAAAEARFLALDYDVDATRRELAAAGLPAEACHLKPRRLPRLLRGLRRGAA